MIPNLKVFHVSTLFTLLFATQSSSTSLTESLLSGRVPRDTGKYSREKYPRYVNDNTDKTIKPEDIPDRDTGGTNSLGKRCITCIPSALDKYPTYDRNPYDRNRNYDDYYNKYREYDRYDDRDRYYERDRYYDRNDRYSDRDRIYRGRDRYSDRDRNYDPYDYDRGYEPYERYDRYSGRDRTYFDPYERYDRYSDRGIGYDNRGYDYRGYDSRYDTHPYRSYDDVNRYAPRDFGPSGYASRWNYGPSSGERDDYYYRDRHPSYRPLNKDPVRDSTRDPVRDPYNDTYRPTSYLYGRPSSTTLKPPASEDSNTQAPQNSSR